MPTIPRWWIDMDGFIDLSQPLCAHSKPLGTTIYKQPSSRHFTFAEHFRFELTGYLRLVLFFLVEENRDRFALPTSISNLLPILHVTLTSSIQQIVFCGFCNSGLLSLLNVKFKPLPRILQLLSSQNLQDFLNFRAGFYNVESWKHLFCTPFKHRTWVLTARRASASWASALACHDNALVANWPSLSLWYGDLCWKSCHSERPAKHFCRRQESVYPDQNFNTNSFAMGPFARKKVSTTSFPSYSRSLWHEK